MLGAVLHGEAVLYGGVTAYLPDGISTKEEWDSLDEPSKAEHIKSLVDGKCPVTGKKANRIAQISDSTEVLAYFPCHESIAESIERGKEGWGVKVVHYDPLDPDRPLIMLDETNHVMDDSKLYIYTHKETADERALTETAVNSYLEAMKHLFDFSNAFMQLRQMKNVKIGDWRDKHGIVFPGAKALSDVADSALYLAAAWDMGVDPFLLNKVHKALKDEDVDTAREWTSRLREYKVSVDENHLSVKEFIDELSAAFPPERKPPHLIVAKKTEYSEVDMEPEELELSDEGEDVIIIRGTIETEGKIKKGE